MFGLSLPPCRHSAVQNDGIICTSPASTAPRRVDGPKSCGLSGHTLGAGRAGYSIGALERPGKSAAARAMRTVRRIALRC